VQRALALVIAALVPSSHISHSFVQSLVVDERFCLNNIRELYYTTRTAGRVAFIHSRTLSVPEANAA